MPFSSVICTGIYTTHAAVIIADTSPITKAAHEGRPLKATSEGDLAECRVSAKSVLHVTRPTALTSTGCHVNTGRD